MDAENGYFNEPSFPVDNINNTTKSRRCVYKFRVKIHKNPILCLDFNTIGLKYDDSSNCINNYININASPMNFDKINMAKSSSSFCSNGYAKYKNSIFGSIHQFPFCCKF